MLGGLLALCSAATFAFNNAGIRRGVLSGSVLQAMAITVPLGVPAFFIVAALTGFLGAVADFSFKAIWALAVAGIMNFVWARYCIYRATKAIGMNLVAPLQQLNLVVTLVLAVALLGEKLDLLRMLGIGLVFLGPAITTVRDDKKKAAPPPARGETQSTIAASADAAITKPAEPKPQESKGPAFKPNYVEGYTYSLLSTLGYGLTPILVRFALEDRGLGPAIAGGLVAYVAATTWPPNTSCCGLSQRLK